MPAPFESDTDRLAELTALGQSVTYTPSGGVAAPIYVIFDNVDVVSEVTGAVVGYKPVAEARTSDLTGAVVGGTLLISGTTYTIETNLQDGTGMTTMELSEA